MGSKRRYAGMMLAALLAVFIGTGVVVAKDRTAASSNGESVTVAQSQTHDGALYGAGESVTVAGTVKGDVYCAAQTVTITGTVDGDVICAAQTIRIDGTVNGDVRLAGQQISLDGSVTGTASTFAQNVDLGDEAVIGGDLNGAATSVLLQGKVTRDVQFVADSLTVNGVVQRNIDGTYDRLSVQNGASVTGNVRYASEQDASIAEGAVQGAVARTPVTSENRNDDAGEFFAGAAVYSFVSMLLIALVVALVAPRLIHAITDNGVTRLLQSLLVGFFVVFGLPIVLILLALTVIGIPLAGLIFLTWLLVIILSGPAFGYYLGRVIMQNRTANPLLIMLVGASVLGLAYFIPVANIFAVLAALTVGSGMVVLWLAGKYKKPVYSIKKETIRPKSTKA